MSFVSCLCLSLTLDRPNLGEMLAHIILLRFTRQTAHKHSSFPVEFLRA